MGRHVCSGDLVEIDQVKGQFRNTSQGDWKTTHKTGIQRGVCEIRWDVEEQEVVLGRLVFDVDDGGKKSASVISRRFKRVRLGAGYCWNRFVEGRQEFQWRKKQETRSQRLRYEEMKDEELVVGSSSFCWLVMLHKKSNRCECFCIESDSESCF